MLASCESLDKICFRAVVVRSFKILYMVRILQYGIISLDSL